MKKPQKRKKKAETDNNQTSKQLDLKEQEERGADYGGLPKKVETDNQTTKQGDLKEEDERRIDYGGLPGRNLKKNLGCG